MKKTGEFIVHVIFFLLGLITVGCVLLISGYLVVSGIPAIREIGLWNFLFGKVWASTAAEPKFGILPFILTSVYGTAGAILLGVPVGFLTAVYLAKLAPPKVKSMMQSAVSLLAGIPSVVYGTGAGHPEGIPCAGWCESSGGNHCAGDYDTAIHHQGYCHGAGGGARGI